MYLPDLKGKNIQAVSLKTLVFNTLESKLFVKIDGAAYNSVHSKITWNQQNLKKHKSLWKNYMKYT